MCTPTVAVALVAASTAMNMVGNYYQGRVNEKVMRYQAGRAETEAGQITAAGREAERQQRIAAAQAVGAQRAAMGGSGIDVNTGTFLDTQVETAQLGEMDALTIRRNYQQQAWAKRADAAMYRAGAKTARTAGNLGMASSLITGASSVADTYNQFRQPPTMEQKQKLMFDDYYAKQRRFNYNWGR